MHQKNKKFNQVLIKLFGDKPFFQIAIYLFKDKNKDFFLNLLVTIFAITSLLQVTEVRCLAGLELCKDSNYIVILNLFRFLFFVIMFLALFILFLVILKSILPLVYFVFNRMVFNSKKSLEIKKIIGVNIYVYNSKNETIFFLVHCLWMILKIPYNIFIIWLAFNQSLLTTIYLTHVFILIIDWLFKYNTSPYLKIYF